jgi:dTDP-glucose 4,6-dehydratase
MSAATAHHPRNVLVTGGAGFIGLNFVRYLLEKYPEVSVVTLDLLTYAGSRADLEAIADPARHVFVHGDIADALLVRDVLSRHRIDTIINFAAESHVDRSIDAPAAFVRTNVVGTFTLLEAARDAWPEGGGSGSTRFHQVSTDEVYGSLADDEPPFTERTPYAPNSPYAASKAAADHLVRAYHRTYGLPVTITNCSNNYGPYQHAEKFIPTVIQSCLDGQPIPIYGAGTNVRDWLHVSDHCTAVDLAVRSGRPGETYLVGANNEWRNIDLARQICRLLDELRPLSGKRYEELIASVADRRGHDFRYALDGSKMCSELGWQPAIGFDDGLRSTVEWYLARLIDVGNIC